MRVPAAFVVCLSAFAVPALAADVTTVPPYDWSGAYFGVQAGVARTADHFRDPNYHAPPATYGNFDLTGLVAGAHAGYNAQFDEVVLGLETDFEFAGGSGHALDATKFVKGSASPNWEGSTRLRLGYAFDQALLYATGGVAYGNFDLGYQFPVPAGTTDSFSDTLVGYTVGGGLEYALSDSISARVEYRYSDFGSASGSIADCCAPAPNAQRHSLTSHQVRAGISWHF